MLEKEIKKEKEMLDLEMVVVLDQIMVLEEEAEQELLV